jgi:hypothetical protein
MKSNYHWGRFVAVAAVLLLVGSGAAMAQLQTGNLYGKVSDQTGAALPGVTVTLDTGEAPQVQVTNAQGEFRFLSLAPATYKIKAELQGFSPVEYPRIVINVGRNTSIEVTMNSAVEDVITVTSESPLLDEKAIRTGNTVSQNELQKIPTARDPWTVLQSTPGVLVDRVNVGGNYSGQQSFYTGPGSLSTQSVWSVDGVVITDMSALGSTPAYYDFDSFEEMQISTGGSDVSTATGGVALNLVTKRGTNEYRGSARYLQVPGSTQSGTSFTINDVPAAQRPSFFGGSNKIDKIEDYGGEIGGPILKDHLWLWGAYGTDKVAVHTFPSRRSPNGQPDKTELPTWNAKMNAQLTSSNSATLVAFNNSKKKTGRNAGPTRPPETTFNQGQFGGTPSLLKAEDTQIFSPNLYLTVLYSHVYGGFFLLPQSGTGPDIPPSFLDSSGVFHNSFFGERIRRPQVQEKADASTFFNTGSVSNELKYGAAYRTATTITTQNWQGGGWIAASSITPADPNFLLLTRQDFPKVAQKYTSAYAPDTLTTGNLTANIGLRYDRQTGDNLAGSVPANFLEPTLLPAQSYAGGPIGFAWHTWSPRLGVTYALGKDRSTLLRASYSRFADQLGGTIPLLKNPLGAISYYYAATSYSGTGPLTPSQILPIGAGWSANTINGVLKIPNTVASNYNAPVTDELLLSAEHALLPEFVVGLNLTGRIQRNLTQEDALVFDAAHPNTLNYPGRPATRADFEEQFATTTLPNGQVAPFTYWILKPGLTTAHGYFYHNGDYQTTYKGASLTFNKRLANRWMMRGNITYQDWYFNKAGDRPDPTELLAGGTTDGFYVQHGDAVVQGSGPGSGNFQNVYIYSKWSFGLNGMYQISPDRPWGFNVAGNLTGRQGYPDPYYFNLPSSLNGRLSVINPNLGFETVQVGGEDSNRLDNIIDFDLRLEKEFTFQDFGLTLGVDCFNVFNESFVLQRQGKLSATANAGFVNEVLSPRVFRFG